MSPYSFRSRSCEKRTYFPARTLWFLCRCRHKNHKCKNVLGHLPERLRIPVKPITRSDANRSPVGAKRRGTKS